MCPRGSNYLWKLHFVFACRTFWICHMRPDNRTLGACFFFGFRVCVALVSNVSTREQFIDWVSFHFYLLCFRNLPYRYWHLNSNSLLLSFFMVRVVLVCTCLGIGAVGRISTISFFLVVLSESVRWLLTVVLQERTSLFCFVVSVALVCTNVGARAIDCVVSNSFLHVVFSESSICVLTFELKRCVFLFCFVVCVALVCICVGRTDYCLCKSRFFSFVLYECIIYLLAFGV